MIGWLVGFYSISTLVGYSIRYPVNMHILNVIDECIFCVALSAWAVEYANCISTERSDSLNECPRYDIKQSDGQAPVILELWRMQRTLSLPSLSVPFWPGVVAQDRVLSIGSNKLCSYARLNYLKLNCCWSLNCVLTLNWIFGNRTVLTFNCV